MQRTQDTEIESKHRIQETKIESIQTGTIKEGRSEFCVQNRGKVHHR